MYKPATKNNSGQEQKPQKKGLVSGKTNTRQQSPDKALAINPIAGDHSALPMQCKALGDNQAPAITNHKPIERKDSSANNGLPMQLKTAIEELSGFAMDDVKVHYHSNKPAQLHAHAYAQGNDIYLGPGQEKHLPHEAWHVVQQKQARVKPTLQLKNKTTINHSDSLEKEADVMGHKIATHSKTIQQSVAPRRDNDSPNPMANGPVVNGSVIQCRLKS
ncbi:MAG: DUF4157 domain-containing protein, partial [Pseudomonadota bacterium]